MLFLGIVAVLACTAPDARAQAAAPAADPAPRARFLTAYRFHLNASAFDTGDRRFSWTGELGGDVDLVDYRRGRLTAVAAYEVVVGSELRTFDPSQSNYTLDFGASYRYRRVEVTGLFHHVSRHRGDRVRERPIDWNMAGLRASAAFERRGWQVDVFGQVLDTILRTSVDYDAEARAGVRGRRHLRGALWAQGAAEFVHVKTEDDFNGRSQVSGGRLEAAVRLVGSAGALELFAAVERRVDPFPETTGHETWPLIGFRLVSR